MPDRHPIVGFSAVGSATNVEPPVTPSDGSALAQPAVLSAQIDATNGSSGPATKAVRDYWPGWSCRVSLRLRS